MISRGMRRLTCAGLSVALLLLATAGEAAGQTLREENFSAATEAEAVLELTAGSPGASWIERGKEAASLRIFLDGRYHQDLILCAGAKPFAYRLLLGRVAAGEHTVRVEFNRRLTAGGLDRATVESLKVELLPPSHPEFTPIAHAPILLARHDTIGRFSDVPLLLYYETLKENGLTVYRYTAIFSNEDGGTQTSGLMARWGRTTDIEWVCEVHLDGTGRAVKVLYQGISHQTKELRSAKEADHPRLLVASSNNNFDDNGVSEMRFALRPIPVDLTSASREEVMDRHPWTYRVMAEEMIREGKITTERTLGESIADLRHYLYADLHSLQLDGSALSLAVRLSGDPKWYTSNLGINSYKVDRPGFFRTTVLLPPGTTSDRIERIAVRCDVSANPRTAAEVRQATKARCDLQSINKLFFLDREFRPAAPLLVRSKPVSLSFGEVVEFQPERSARR